MTGDALGLDFFLVLSEGKQLAAHLGSYFSKYCKKSLKSLNFAKFAKKQKREFAMVEAVVA